MALYNKYYKKENYFGAPYPELIAYAQTLDKDLKVLDIGCGQGRDAIALARLGFEVTGLDISDVGIHQMNEKAILEGLRLDGIVIDYQVFKDYASYDVLLLDSMFHFNKKDLQHEIDVLNMLIDHMKPHAKLIIFIQQSTYRINMLKKIMFERKHPMLILHEQSLIYQAFDSPFYMLVSEKIES